MPDGSSSAAPGIKPGPIELLALSSLSLKLMAHVKGATVSAFVPAVYIPCPLGLEREESGHRHNTDHNDNHLNRALTQILDPMEFGDEIRHRDVDETSGCDRQEQKREMFGHATQDERDRRTRYRSERREEIKPERPRLGVSHMNEHSEISYFLRNFVENHGNRRCDADLNGDEITCRDNHAVDKIVNAV